MSKTAAKPTTTPPPTPDESEVAREAFVRLMADAETCTGDEAARGHLHVQIEGSDDLIGLPNALRGMLQVALQHLAAGRGVQLLPLERDLTTHQAASVLGVSRPHLVKLLEAGDIPFYRTGTHRKVRLDDVLAYRDRLHAGRETSLDELHDLSRELGLYE